MIVAAALAMALMGGHHPVAPATRRFATGGWTLTVHTDGFTGGTSCSVRANRVAVRRRTVIFDLGRGVDTDRAQFRIDGGAARSVQTVTLENAHHGVFPERGWIDNPSRGEVALPVASIEGARLVYIRATAYSRPLTFNVRRLGAVLRSAAGLGCPALL